MGNSKIATKLAMYIALLITIVMVIAGAWVWAKQPNVLPIQSIRVEGKLQYVNRHQVEQALLPFVIGKGFISADVEAVRDRLLQIPWIARVTVYRVWPSTLVVRVTEHVPVARWGEHELLNGQMMVFRPTIGTMPRNLPMLRGPIGQHDHVWHCYRAMQRMLASLGLSIAEVRLSARHAWAIRLTNGIEILLGREDPIARLKRFVAAYPKVFASPSVTAKRVDLRYAAGGMAVQWK